MVLTKYDFNFLIFTIVIFVAEVELQETSCPMKGYLTEVHINSAYEAALSKKRSLDSIEQQIHERGLHTEPHSAAHLHHKPSHTDDDLLKKSRDMGQLQLEITKHIKNRTMLPYEIIFSIENHAVLKEHLRSQICPKEPFCVVSKYRSMDGSCNNLQHPLWGTAFNTFDRWLPSDYDDGFNSPRITGVDGHPLPNPRILSTSLSPDINIPNKRLNNLGNQYGQFLAHDIAKAEKNDHDCCDKGLIKDSALQHPDCFPILIPKNDYFYSQFQQECMSFVRSDPAVRPDCMFGPREQVTSVSSFIDGSAIYGSSEHDAKNLRLFEGGKLRGSSIGGRNILPPNEHDHSNIREDELPVFKTGDSRCNQNLLLTSFHTLWFREHNRIATTLEGLNPGWSDELTYQETRRIVIALVQHIFYQEYLPAILGRKTMQKYQLEVQQSGYSVHYDKNENPAVSNAFAMSAFRFGHTLVQNWLDLSGEDRRTFNYINLSKQYKRPIALYQKDKLDQLIRGTTTQPAQSYDTFISRGLSDHLFQAYNKSYGTDLMAIDIQRGRDHGLPSYKYWRKFCGLKDFNSFDDLYEFMDARSIDIFKKLYRNSDDIDLFVASLAEIPDKYEMLGPTVLCLLGKQLRKTKISDRFWYENGGLSTSFTEDQLQEIRKFTFARVVCDNTHITYMQPKSFLLPNKMNRLQPCTGGFISRMNLELWSAKAGYSPLLA